MSTEYEMLPATKEDIIRIEETLKELASAVRTMILIDERQTVQGARIGKLEQDLATVKESLNNIKSKLESWINRGIGAWGIAIVAWSVINFVARH
jgi:SMC interacting uncharacterized protein involved in chromosome segregation